MAVNDGDLVTGQSGHEVYLIEEGKRRWVPDTWTMKVKDLRPSDLKIVPDDELLQIPKGDAIESEVPPFPIVHGKYYETSSGVFLAKDGKLAKILDPSSLGLTDGFDSRKVTYLPDSLVRR